MNTLIFRDLTSDEVECRVGMSTDKGCTLLLYKDARCDMNILDETVGALNWTRQHARENANCIVSIWDDEKKQWISKEDTGTESYTEKEKGQASDSFKRACVNWGIGRELYTSPFIWINAKDLTYDAKNRVRTRFKCSYLEVKNKKVVGVEIINERTKKILFAWGTGFDKKENKEYNKTSSDRKIDDVEKEILLNALDNDENRISKMEQYLKVENISDVRLSDYTKIINKLLR